VNHHVNEEHRRLFPRVKRAELDLDELGRELQARKQELEAELRAAMTDESGANDDDLEADDDASGPVRGGMAASSPAGDDR